MNQIVAPRPQKGTTGMTWGSSSMVTATTVENKAIRRQTVGSFQRSSSYQGMWTLAEVEVSNLC